jgi:hypothetical protein
MFARFLRIFPGHQALIKECWPKYEDAWKAFADQNAWPDVSQALEDNENNGSTELPPTLFDGSKEDLPAKESLSDDEDEEDAVGENYAPAVTDPNEFGDLDGLGDAAAEAELEDDIFYDYEDQDARL